MAEIVRMPEVMAGATEAAIQTWLVSVGTTVTVGASLAEVETEKAIIELAAEAGGTVGRLLVAEGENVAVGDPVLVLVADGEGDDAIEAALRAAGAATAENGAQNTDGPSAEAGTAAAPASPDTAAPVPAPDIGVATGAAAPEEYGEQKARSRLFASPLARRLAASQGIALEDVAGTGPDGRVTRRDLERHLASTPAAEAPESETATRAPTPAETVEPPTTVSADYEDIPVDRMRRTIARRLTESKSTVPHFYLVADCRADALLALRGQINESAPRKISVNDFVLKAVAAALVEVPAANAIWLGESIRRFSTVDIAVAVATEGGLTTPVVRGVHRTPLGELSATVTELAARARAGRLRQHELEGGSFSVSNLGMYGTNQFSAILNPPQSGILAVGAARRAPIIDDNGELTTGTVMTVTLSADHRVLDGAVAAQWLAAFQRRIENPLSILI
ncbi:2-oxo acid dehydrogenase subunit E2 [Arthrobacter sp. B0490]|uniref:2-oxo acid dehydrogenase subunit E2 n=1 Tax=Arthrobacter sp. B0490 TaxID=2058891 RepID=UPI000CE2BDBA|nr:2-oxo acid dehydrogenase subunit E2 [Arthrobacter sp. B0490]